MTLRILRLQLILILIIAITLSCDSPQRASFDKVAFRDLMHTVAQGWNNGNAAMAANCFNEDAIYIEPPNQQLYKGKEEIFDFFGGEKGRNDPMDMTWHNLIFDEVQQTGTGEYTFKYKGRITHGLVIIQIFKGKIHRWREYQYRTDLEWDEFINESDFIEKQQ